MKRVLIIFLLVLSSCTAVNKANKFYDEGNYTSAIVECQKIISKDSLNAGAHYVLGKCYHAQKRFKLAIQSLTTAYHIPPETNITSKAKSELIITKLQFADTLNNQQKYSLALEQYQSILELDSSNTDCLMKLSDLYYQNGSLSKARDQYKKVLRLYGENQIAIDKIEKIDRRTELAEEDYQKGEKQFKKQRHTTALKYLKKALKNKPDHKDAQYYLALSRGLILYKKGSKSNLWDAIEQFGKAMTLKPESGKPHYYLARAYEKKDRREFDNAIQEYKIVLEKEPNGNFARQSKRKIKELTELRDRLKKFWGE